MTEVAEMAKEELLYFIKPVESESLKLDLWPKE